MNVRGRLVFVSFGLIIALAGCSRADPSLIAAAPNAPAGGTETAGGPASLDVSADPTGQLKYVETTLAGPADQPIAVNFTNPAQVQHNWVLVQPGQEQAVVDAAGAQAGNAVGISVDGLIVAGEIIQGTSEQINVPPSAAGDYTYLCTVPGHYAAGMHGTLTLGAAAEGGNASPGAEASGGAASGEQAGGAAPAVSTDPGGALAFQQTTMDVPAGQNLAVAFSNPSPLQHNWVLVKPGQEQAVVDAAAAKAGDATGDPNAIAAGAVLNSGQSENVTVPSLEPGTYTYICTVPGHYAAGMKGTLTAK